MMGVTGTLTVELFLMPDQRLVVNELAPRVHNSGHWTIEGAATSQFEQHVRAICGLDLGSTEALAPTAMVNLLGTGPARPARLDSLGLARAMADPAVHLHLYDKRQVFERRKMGHVTAHRTIDRRGAGARPRRGRAACAGEDDDEPTSHETASVTADRAGPVVGVVGGSRSDFPVLEDAVDGPRRARGAGGAAGRLRPSDAGPPLPLRRGGRRPRDPGDHRGGGWGGPPAGHARGEDDRCRSSACRSRPSTWAGWTRCSRSSRCRAASRSRPSPSATRRTPGCWPRRSWPSATRAWRTRLAEWRARQTASVLDDPSNASEAARSVRERRRSGRRDRAVLGAGAGRGRARS